MKKGIYPIKYKYKIKETVNHISFFDDLGINEIACMRYSYNKILKTIIRYEIEYNNLSSNKFEHIAYDIPNDINTISEIVYEDHAKRN